MQLPRNNEEAMGDAILDQISGGRYTVAKGFGMVFTKLFSINALALLHHRFGSHFITISTVFWNVAVMGIALLMSSGDSRTVFKIQFWVTIAACIYHLIEARGNLRSYAKGKRRHSLAVGESLLWKPFCKLTNALKIGSPSDYGFQKYVEPALCLVLALIFFLAGFHTSAFFFFMGASASFALYRNIEDTHFRRKQEMWDAGQEGEIIEEAQQPTQPANRVARPVARRAS